MTTLVNRPRTCTVCGTKSHQAEIRSASAFDHPDLDLRPSENQRSTIAHYLEVCPHCGYVAHRIAVKASVSEDLLKSESYLTCDGRRLPNELTRNFYRRYLLSKASGDNLSAFFALLHGAWACDDAEESCDEAAPAAFELRQMALCEVDSAISAITADSDREALLVVKADLLRRSGQFDEVLRQCPSWEFTRDIYHRMIRYQLYLAKRCDDRCHTVTEALQESPDFLG